MATRPNLDPQLAAGSISIGSGVTNTLQTRIANGREFCLNAPEVCYLLTILPILQRQIEALKTRPVSEIPVYFELTYRGQIQSKYDAAIENSKMGEKYTPEQLKIDNAVKSLFVKLNVLVPTTPVINRQNEECHRLNPTEPYAIDLRQAVELANLGRECQEFLANLRKTGKPVSHPITTGSKIPFPSTKAYLSREQCKAAWSILDEFTKDAIPQDEIVKDESYICSPTGWHVYGSTDPKYYLCSLQFKNPMVVEFLIKALDDAGFPARYLRRKDTALYYVGVLLECEALNSDSEVQKLKAKAQVAKQGIIEKFKAYIK